MANIAKRPDGRYRARYRDGRGREHAKHFDLKRDAQRWLDEVATAVTTGQYVDPVRSRATVGSVADAWVENPSWAASTRARNRSILRAHVSPQWSDVRLADMQHEDIQKWVNELTRSGMAGGTVRKTHGALKGILQLAVKGKRLAVNPADNIDLPRQDIKRYRYLSAAEVETLASVAGSHAVIVHVLAYCGLRFGELAGLKVGAVDLERRRFRIEISASDVNGKLVWSAPKDHQRRSVPWPGFLDYEISKAIKGKAPDELVFPSPEGYTLRVRNMRTGWFDRATAQAEVDGLTPKGLRHTSASLAVSAGASVLALQRMLGHEKPSTTLNVYSDLFDEDLDAVADRLADRRAVAVADQMRTD